MALTYEQLAALDGTFRETCTKVLRDYADHGLLRLARGRLTVMARQLLMARRASERGRSVRTVSGGLATLGKPE
ncbi:helix-turn-helix domain-containing protein [Streptomyces sp. NPDC059153]|uniref:helix-turn-helix domain-containing protein n=1 Tax=Streptomyces sp. NPDC059153 TaxID=3346743 RepID=UPI0036B17E37